MTTAVETLVSSELSSDSEASASTEVVTNTVILKSHPDEIEETATNPPCAPKTQNNPETVNIGVGGHEIPSRSFYAVFEMFRDAALSFGDDMKRFMTKIEENQTPEFDAPQIPPRTPHGYSPMTVHTFKDWSAYTGLDYISIAKLELWKSRIGPWYHEFVVVTLEQPLKGFTIRAASSPSGDLEGSHIMSLVEKGLQFRIDRGRRGVSGLYPSASHQAAVDLIELIPSGTFFADSMLLFSLSVRSGMEKQLIFRPTVLDLHACLSCAHENLGHDYHLLNRNCWSFASLVFRFMGQLFPITMELQRASDAAMNFLAASTRKKFGGFRPSKQSMVPFDSELFPLVVPNTGRLPCRDLRYSPHRDLLVDLLLFFPLSKVHPKLLLSQIQKAMVLFGYSSLQRGLAEMGVVQELVGIIKMYQESERGIIIAETTLLMLVSFAVRGEAAIWEVALADVGTLEACIHFALKHPKNAAHVSQFLAALGYQSEVLTQHIIEFGGLKLLTLALRDALNSRDETSMMYALGGLAAIAISNQEHCNAVAATTGALINKAAQITAARPAPLDTKGVHRLFRSIPKSHPQKDAPISKCQLLIPLLQMRLHFSQDIAKFNPSEAQRAPLDKLTRMMLGDTCRILMGENPKIDWDLYQSVLQSAFTPAT